MGNKYKNRRDFFNTLLNRADEEETTAVADTPGIPIKEAPPGPDKMFERFSRKELSGRRYAPLTKPEDEGTTAARVAAVTSGLTAYSGAWGDEEVAHLLRRTGFGVKLADIATLKALTMSSAVDAVLNITTTPTTPSATPLNYFSQNITGTTDSSGVAYGANWTTTNMSFAATSNDSTVDSYRQNSLQAWHWGLWLSGDYTIREKMVQFWHHFIPVDFNDVRNSEVNGATMCAEYMKLLRDNATGNFKTLIQAIAKSPAMLVFLSGQYSTASAPNENFGRELMELFTLGKLPTQNYDEFDIKAAAKVFSGWKVKLPTGTATGNPFAMPYPFTVDFVIGSHNTTNKVFSANFGTTTITGGTTATTGAAEFATFFNMLFTQQGTTIAKYICRRLYRFFVYYDIDATTETNIIGPLATTLMTANPSATPATAAWDVLPVLQQLFKSQHFYDMANRGVMIKAPVDFITGVISNFGLATTAANSLTLPATNQVYNQYTFWKYLNDYCNNYLEQSVGLVPNVSGYKAYYQAPGYYQNWINTNTIQRRTSFLGSLISTNGITAGGVNMKIDVMAFTNQFSQTVIADPDLLVAAMVKILLPLDPGQTVRDNLKIANLLAQQVQNHYWTDAWNAYYGPPIVAANLGTVKTRLTNLITAIIKLAEYQLM